MTGDYPRLRLRGIPEVRVIGLGKPPRRQLLVREVFRIVFYMPHDHPDIALGVSHAIDSYMRAVGEGPGSITHAHINYSEGSPLSAARWETVHRVLRHTKRLAYPDDYSETLQWIIEKQGFERGVLLAGGFAIRNGYELEYKARIPWSPPPEETFTSLLTATLPLEYLEAQGTAWVRQLVLDMASQVRFATGHAGLALHFYWSLPRTDESFRLEALRHPGIDLRQAWRHEEWMGFQVDGVHWLNFLGPPVLTQLGGASALRARLHSAGTTVVDLDAERAVVSLGERPEAGDSTVGETLPAYRELARVLEPWLEPLFLKTRALIEAPRYTGLLLTEEEARRWWRRFLD